MLILIGILTGSGYGAKRLGDRLYIGPAAPARLGETPPALNVADTTQNEPPYVLMSGGELEALRAAGRIEAFLARYR